MKTISAIALMAFLFVGTVGSPIPFTATAYCLKGRTASGHKVARGIVAADTRILPLGTKIKIEHEGYSGVYVVRDTGGKIRGKRLDIWVPSKKEALKFGRRKVKVTVLS
jgi:3D (Asp-Asp-Asp) domain-containing protein